MARPVAQQAIDLVRIDMIRPYIGGGHGGDLDVLTVGILLENDLPREFCNVHDRHVLVADIEDLIADFLVGCGEEQLDGFYIVLNMQIGPQLRTSEDGDLVIVHRMVRKNIDREIQALARRIAANRRRPESHADEFLIRVLSEERLTEALIFVVKRQRHEGMILGDVGLIRDAIDGG